MAFGDPARSRLRPGRLPSRLAVLRRFPIVGGDAVNHDGTLTPNDTVTTDNTGGNVVGSVAGTHDQISRRHRPPRAAHGRGRGPRASDSR